MENTIETAGVFMNKYMLLFHNNDEKLAALSPSQVQALGQKWWAWMESLKKQGVLESTGERLTPAAQARWITGEKKVVSDGPFTEAKDAVGGYMFVKTVSLDQAVEVAKGCPIFDNGGSLEVRSVLVP